MQITNSDSALHVEDYTYLEEFPRRLRVTSAHGIASTYLLDRWE